jgi:hypothetical protein
MPSLSVYRGPEQVSMPSPPGACPRCAGSGVAEGEYGPEDCPTCDGFGRVVYAERAVLLPPRLVGSRDSVYVVAVAAGQLEEGYDLELLLSDVVRAWGDSPDDIAVWHDRGEDGCRLVAVVRPTQRGPSVTWL